MKSDGLLKKKRELNVVEEKKNIINSNSKQLKYIFLEFAIKKKKKKMKLKYFGQEVKETLI